MDSSFTLGYCFGALSVDGITKYVVNVCGNPSVGMPLARSMDAVSEAYIDHNGVDNLIIPISVSNPMRLVKEDFSYSVDVVVHPCLTSRCSEAHHLRQHLIMKLTALAVQWIRQESGVSLIERSCSVVNTDKYFVAQQKRRDDASNFMNLLSNAARQAGASRTDAESSLPCELNLNAEKHPSKEPLIREIVSDKGMKKGFLVDKAPELYGPNGSPEGNGKQPDALSHIPESIRSRCKIIDTRTMSEVESKGCASPKSIAPTAPAISPSTKCSVSPLTDANRWSAISVTIENGILTARFNAPSSVTKISDVNLDVTEESIELDSEITILPTQIDVSTVKAKYLKSSRILTITCSTV